MGIAQVKLPVSDLRRSAGWYRELLGLRPWTEFVEDGVVRGVGLIAEGARFCVALRDRATYPSNPALSGVDVVAFRPRDRAALDELVEHCERIGVATGGVQERPGGAWLDIADPDGTVLRFYFTTDSFDGFTGVEFRSDGAPRNYGVPRLR